jgi:Cu/Ag efflux protein CusF
VATVAIPKDGDYHSKGVVTKINLEIGSIELNHEEIKDVMPAMQMEFFVGDKKLLDGIKVGDKVDFVLRYKDPGETIVSITKTQ